MLREKNYNRISKCSSSLRIIKCFGWSYDLFSFRSSRNHHLPCSHAKRLQPLLSQKYLAPPVSDRIRVCLGYLILAATPLLNVRRWTCAHTWSGHQIWTKKSWMRKWQSMCTRAICPFPLWSIPRSLLWSMLFARGTNCLVGSGWVENSWTTRMRSYRKTWGKSWLAKWWRYNKTAGVTSTTIPLSQHLLLPMGIASSLTLSTQEPWWRQLRVARTCYWNLYETQRTNMDVQWKVLWQITPKICRKCALL